MSITMYIHHDVHQPEVMAEGDEGVRAKLDSLGHDVQERWFASADMGHALLISEFGSSRDVVLHFEALEELGFTAEALGTIFTITSADVVGELDDEARTLLSKYDFVNFLEAMPGMHD